MTRVASVTTFSGETIIVPDRYHVYQQGHAMQFTINGKSYTADPDIRTSVLDLCREHLGLTGSKKGCDHGQCGACTVLINGRRDQFLPDAGSDAPGRRDHDDRRVWVRSATCTRSRRRS